MKYLYKITILNWGKYNKNSKPNLPSVMISKRFFDDHAIINLPAGGKLLYLGLLLRRGEDPNTFDGPSKEVIDTSFIASHDLLVRLAGGSGQVVERLLMLLQENQLLTYEKMPPNRIEKKRKESKVKENKGTTPQKIEAPVEQSSTTKDLVAHYCDTWKARYGFNPPISPKVAGQIKRMMSDYGFEKCKIYITAYCNMPDQWFVTKRHDLPTLLANINSVAQFAETGRMLTRKETKAIEERVSTQNLLNEIDRVGI